MHPNQFTRESAISAALEAFDSGRFLADLDRRVSYRTESQVESSAPELQAYLRNEIAPTFGRLGFTCRIVANPAGVDAPVLLAERIEGKDLPTVVTYAHGDVVRGYADQWREGLEPWKVVVEGDRRVADLGGRGHLLVTASAAGLLSMLGSAPYAVTKHAAVAFAEWMRLTYSHRGIVVQALCPQGVRTPMLLGGRTGESRSADGARSAARTLLDDTAISPEQVADAVVEAMADDRFLVLPHPEVATYYARRAADPDRWLRGMNKLQRTAVEPAAGPAGTDLL